LAKVMDGPQPDDTCGPGSGSYGSPDNDDDDLMQPSGKRRRLGRVA